MIREPFFLVLPSLPSPVSHTDIALNKVLVHFIQPWIPLLGSPGLKFQGFSGPPEAFRAFRSVVLWFEALGLQGPSDERRQAGVQKKDTA